MSSATATSVRENVLYEKKGATAYVTLNRPKVLNALNKATIAELSEVFNEARDDAAVRGVILTGAGDKAFAAGADISEMANDTPTEAEDKTRQGQRLTWTSRTSASRSSRPSTASPWAAAASWRWLARSDWPSRRRSSASRR